ncbi:phosphoribosylglycinamide formyltransferase-1 [Marinospirillum celere]|uniref:Phosphoribosylglycinamide formyltransferase n=1 Tax=Marinospirillum celere TaxID=1122252 RepID=A0A1I1ESN2_9GAMM|nr:phosphoribosylglycinamide formyltransferase [Marinospirillum celere]SFB88528.1 phosphoribosylglycinamide formyltransferase-1 [Marinospirillum celere]
MIYSSQPAEGRRLVVLISGNGSNLQALLDAQQSEEGLGGQIVAVVSDQADAYGLERARQAGVAAEVLPAGTYTSREDYDQALIRLIDDYQPDLLVLAGFMRILSPAFVLRYHGRLLNIHPSLLPKYKGLHTHRRALEAGDNEHGVSIHFVTEELDGGPLVIQAKVPVEVDDDEKTLARRVQVKEHLLYPIVVRWFLQGRLQLQGDQPQLDGQPLPKSGVLYQESA